MTSKEAIDASNHKILSESITSFHSYLLKYIGQLNSQASQEQILKYIDYFKEALTITPHLVGSLGDQILICFYMLIVPTMDIEIRENAWKVILNILKICIFYNFKLLSWPQIFQICFLLPGDKVKFEYPVIKVDQCVQATPEDLQCEILQLIQLIDPKSPTKFLRTWFTFLVQHIIPNIFKYLASKSRIIRRVSGEFLRLISNTVSLHNDLWPFICNTPDTDPIDCMKNLIQHSFDAFDDLEQFNEAQIFHKFITTAFPIVIKCRKTFDNIPEDFEQNVDKFALEIGMLLRMKIPLNELLSWFDCTFDPELDRFLQVLLNSKLNIQQLFHVILFYIYGAMIQYMYKLEVLYDSHAPLPQILSPLFELMMTFRCLFDFGIKQPQLRQSCEPLPQMLMTLRFKTKTPLALSIFAMSIFDSQKIDIQTINRNFQSMANPGTGHRNILDSLCHFLQFFAVQFALVLGKFFGSVHPSFFSPIQLNALAFERENVKLFKNSSVEHQLMLFYNMPPDGWDERLATTFLTDFLTVADNYTGFESSCKVIQALNMVSGPAQLLPVHRAIASRLLNLQDQISSEKIESVFSVVKSVYGLPDFMRITDSKTDLQLVKMLLRFISLSSDRVFHDVARFSIDEILLGHPFFFLLIPALVVTILSPSKTYPTVLEESRYTIPENFQRYLSLLTTVILLPQPKHDFMSFYESIVSTDFMYRVRSFYTKCSVGSNCLNIIKDVIIKGCSCESFTADFIFCILIKQILIDHEVSDNLIAIICSFIAMSDPSPLVVRLFCIIPFLKSHALKRPTVIGDLITQLKSFFTHCSVNHEIYSHALQAISDYIIINMCTSERENLIDKYYVNKEDEFLDSITVVESRYLMKRIGKDRSISLPLRDSHLFNQVSKEEYLSFGQRVEDKFDIFTRSIQNGDSHFVMQTETDSSSLLEELVMCAHSKYGLGQAPKVYSPTNLVNVSVFFRSKESVNSFLDTSDSFRSFLKSLGSPIDSNEIRWTTTRLDVHFQVAALMGDSKEILSNKIAIAWNETSVQLLKSDLKMNDLAVLIRVKPVRNGLVSVSTVPCDIVGPIGSDLLVPCNILSALVQWTVFTVAGILRSKNEKNLTYKSKH